MKNFNDKTSRDVVEALGRENICNRLGFSQTRISNHVVSGKFPPSWYLQLKIIADEQGYELPHSAFRWFEPEEKGNHNHTAA